MTQNKDRTPPNTPRRPRCNWAAVERDFRTGQYTLRELGRMHGGSASQICERARTEGWTRDLRPLIRQATSQAIIRELAAETTAAAQSDTTTVVLAAAEAIKNVIMSHRREVAAARALAADMMAELRVATLEQPALAQLLARAGEVLDEDETQALAQALDNLVSLPVRIQSVQRLADSMARLQTLERRAYGLDQDGAGTPDPLAGYTDADLEREAQRLRLRVAQLGANVVPLHPAGHSAS